MQEQLNKSAESGIKIPMGGIKLNFGEIWYSLECDWEIVLDAKRPVPIIRVYSLDRILGVIHREVMY